MSNKVDEIREQMGKLHKKYNPFTDFNFENDLSIEEYVYHLGDWFKGLLNQFKSLEDTANEVNEQAASSASAAADSAEAAADSAEAAAGSAETAQNIADRFTAGAVNQYWSGKGAGNEPDWRDLPYVTPEMYGAVGDGITDDTTAWQAAVNVGVTVIAQSSIYKCGQVDITKNIYINCNNAKFICSSEYLFTPTGEVVTTLTGQGDYTANQTDFKITDTTYSNYSGYGMIQGDNNWNTFRTYYYGGMVGNFKNGYFYDRIPVDATNTTVLIINPIVCRIANISEVEFTNTHDGKIIYCSYGVNCRFENINVTNECYHIVAFYRCYKCTSVDIFAPLPMYSGSAVNTYPAACFDSSFCTFDNCFIYNPFWHAWTTGANYVCYNNKIVNCEMYSDRQAAIEDHENAIATCVSNTTANGINLTQGGVIENVIMEPRNDTNKNCLIILAGSPDKTLARYSVRNVVYRKTQNTQQFGVLLQAYPQTSNNDIYYTEVNLCNLYNETVVPSENAATIRLNALPDSSKTNSITMGTVLVENSNLRVNLAHSAASIYNETKAKYIIKKCNSIMNITTANAYMYILMNPNADMYIEDTTLSYVSGTGKNVTLNNVTFTYLPNLTITGKLQGSNININTTASGARFSGVNNILITNYSVNNGASIYSKLWRTANDKNVYGEKLNADGTTTVETLVTV